MGAHNCTFAKQPLQKTAEKSGEEREVEVRSSDPARKEEKVDSMSLNLPNLNLPDARESTLMIRSEKGRLRPILKPGHSLMDWLKLSGDNVLASRTMSEVDEVELVKHNTVTDCWIVLEGMVYDVTKYLDFHPGGVELLMMAAGRDGTELFSRYHAWISHANMLRSCFVGPFTGNRSKLPRATETPMETLGNTVSGSAVNQYNISVRTTSGKLQLSSEQWGELNPNNVLVDAGGTRLRVRVKPLLKPAFSFSFDQPLPENTGPITVSVDDSTITVEFGKDYPIDKFPLDSGISFQDDKALEYRECVLAGVTKVNNDGSLVFMKVPDTCWFSIPIGHHVLLRLKDPDEPALIRCYTPVLISSAQRFVIFYIKVIEGGAFTRAIRFRNLGSKLEISDGIGKIDLYERTMDKVLMLAGGTGITPMIRFIAARGGSPPNENHLLVFNKKMDDKVTGEFFNVCCLSRGDFSLEYFTDEEREEVRQGKAVVNEAVLTPFLAPFVNAKSDIGQFKILICGPDGFMKKALKIVLGAGIPRENVFVFDADA